MIFLFAAPSLAQDIPAWEVFGGYSFQRSNVRKYFRATPTLFRSRNEGTNLQGWEVSVTENINRWFGGTLDISGRYARPDVSGTANRDRMYSLMYGPRFSLRRTSSSFTPFAHVLLGAAHMDIKVTPAGPSASDYSFAMAAGGGLDMKFRNKTAIRVFQADYFRANALGANHNNIRLSAGVILYLGL